MLIVKWVAVTAHAPRGTDGFIEDKPMDKTRFDSRSAVVRVPIQNSIALQAIELLECDTADRERSRNAITSSIFP
jgi:hypothetical protein